MNALSGWLHQHPLQAFEVDCVVAIMLKILDGKCKMGKVEKQVMSQLYEAVEHMPGERLEPSLREIIASARQSLNEALRLQIYEQRVLAETTISRPVMKAFKARVRAAGLYNIGV